MNTEVRLRQRLASLAPVSLNIIDDSSLHAGHAGAGGGGHYRVDIVAAIFSGKSTVIRHRLVYDAAGDLLLGPVHALAIKAKAPNEA